MSLCMYCHAERKETGLKNHEIRCKDNPNRKIEGKSEQGLQKIKESAKKQNATQWTPEKRKLHSIAMKVAVEKNPDSYTSRNVCGRVKIYEYKEERFHGNWEVEVAKWLDRQNIRWERKVKPFTYFWKDNWHLYFPDFYLPDFNKFIEVKGFETERDRCKWSVVDNLYLIKKKEIDLIKSDNFTLGL